MKQNLMLMTSLAAMTLLSCGGGSASSSAAKESWTVGVCQLVTHVALDAATNAFVKAVEDGLGKNNVTIDVQNASGETATCNTIVNSFKSKKVDLIMANATASLQAAANATVDIPILGTSITEYGTALGLKNFQGVVGGNISGTSDLAPLSEQAQMLKDLLPEARKVGLLFCSSESNSKYQIDVVEAELKKFDGMEVERLPFTDSNDLPTVLNRAVADKDALYIPTDNTCASCANMIDSICRPAGVPIIAGEEGLCKGCGIASLSISYENIGKKTGEMAVEILKNGADISKMAIAYDEHPVKKYNADICRDLAITIPSDYVAIE